MNEKTLCALVQAGAVSHVRAIVNGASFHLQGDAGAGTLQVDVTRWSRAAGVEAYVRGVASSWFAASASACRVRIYLTLPSSGWQAIGARPEGSFGRRD